MTRSEVLGIDPTERTITQWRVLVDWDLVKQRPWVVVDPMDPTGLLYLSQKDYLAYAKVGASTDLPFIVVCRPGVKRPVSLAAPNNSSSSDSSQNSPWGVKWEGKARLNATFTWSSFSSLRYRIHLLVNKSKPEDKMVSENYNSIIRTVLVWARQLAHYAEVKNAGSIPFYLVPYSGYMKRILKNNGQMALVMHLKVALFALYSFISGNPLTSTYHLGSPMRLDRSGLPLAFGRVIRQQLQGGSLSHIRLMASLLNIYRAMEAPHKPADIASITQPHPELGGVEDFTLFKRFCRDVLPGLLYEHTGHSLNFQYETGLGLIIRSAGANNAGPAMGSIVRDAQAWSNAMENHVLRWFEIHDDVSAAKVMSLCALDCHFGGKEESSDPLSGDPQHGMTMATAYMATRDAFSSLPLDSSGEPIPPKGTKRDPYGEFHAPILGRLHAIDEPAGKVRVVAICDYWTQVAMKPVHDHLFEILKKIKTDATFDQSGLVEGYFKKGYSPHWSFDLKSATDTIPMALYIEVMTVLLRAENDTVIAARQRAELWAKIMTDRDFLTPLKEGYARYGRGQPMGALSSWASMAMVHHALVQFSHWKVTNFPGCEPSWFDTYLVLGDDVDIARNALVADCYKGTCANLGIVIGIHKSLHSLKNCFEFANRRFSPDGDISPLSLKEELASNSWIARLEYAKRILTRFGTSYTDRGLALLRKATTVRQWDVLLPELSGERSDTHYRDAVRFLLENPFSNHELKDLPIEHVLGWLSLLLPEEDKERLSNYMSDSHNTARLSAVVAVKLIELLDMEVQKALDRIPSPNTLTTFTGSDDRVKMLLDRAGVSGLSYTSTEIKEGREGAYRHTITVMMPRDWRGLLDKLENLNAKREIVYPKGGGTYVSGDGSPSNYDASVSLLYNHFCFNKHNEKISDELSLLKRRLVILRSFLPSYPTSIEQVFAADRYVSMRPDLNCDTYFRAALQVWADFANMSKPICPRFLDSCSEWLGDTIDPHTPYVEVIQKSLGGMRSVERYLNILEERTRGPIRALAYGVAKEFGIILPALHDMAFEKAPLKGNSWLTLVRQWKRDGNVSRLASGTALSMVENSEVLLKFIRKARYYWWAVTAEGDARLETKGSSLLNEVELRE